RAHQALGLPAHRCRRPRRPDANHGRVRPRDCEPVQARGRTTATGQVTWCSTPWLTEPNTAEAKPPSPREPTTTRSAAAPAAARALTGWSPTCSLVILTSAFSSRHCAIRSATARAASFQASLTTLWYETPEYGV